MKKMIKKSLTFLMALALIAQVSLTLPSLAVMTYADTDTVVTEAVGTDSGTTQDETDEQDLVTDETLSDETAGNTITDGVDAVAPEPVLGDVADEEITVAEETAPEGTSDGQSNDNQTRAPPTKSAAKSGGDVFLGFTSDVHNQSDNAAATRLGTWIDSIRGLYGSIDYMGFCGDLGDAGASASNFWTYAQNVMDVVTAKGIPACYTTGNHEFSPGNYGSTTNATTQAYTVDAAPTNLPEGANYSIYALGSTSSSQSFTSDQVNHLTTFLTNADADKPIIVLAHFPLHSVGGSGWGGRTTSNAIGVINALNAAANSGKTVIYLWGHNHTLANSSEGNYDQIFCPGDSITYASGSSSNIQFYYGAAGCMSDSPYSSGSAAVQGKGLVIQVRSDGSVGFGYFNASGEDVTEAGNYPQIVLNPVAVTGVSITPPASTNVEVGKTLKLSAAVEPSDATNKKVTWTSSKPEVATVDAN